MSNMLFYKLHTQKDEERWRKKEKEGERGEEEIDGAEDLFVELSLPVISDISVCELVTSDNPN